MLYQDRAPYQGFLMKNVNWQDLPPEALGILTNAFQGQRARLAPRVWLEDEDRTASDPHPGALRGTGHEAQGHDGAVPPGRPRSPAWTGS